MRIIDQKGMVLGRINIIDFSVILIVIFFLLSLFIGYAVVVKKEMIKDSVWVSIKLKLVETEPEFRNIISKGDVEKNAFGETIGRLVDVSSVMPSKVWVIVDNKMLSTIDHPVKKDVIVNAEILCKRKDGILYHKTSPVKIGTTITFETEMYNLSGVVVGLKIGDEK